MGALVGLGVGLGVAAAADSFGSDPGGLFAGIGAGAVDGPPGAVGSLFETALNELLRSTPGLAAVLGGAAGSALTEVLKTRALAGAFTAARFGAAAGVAYLGGYVAGYSFVMNRCLRN
jgi:hypothetical protein